MKAGGHCPASSWYQGEPSEAATDAGMAGGRSQRSPPAERSSRSRPPSVSFSPISVDSYL